VSAIGTSETCPTILNMSVHRVDRKSPWSGQTDANDPRRTYRHLLLCGPIVIYFSIGTLGREFSETCRSTNCPHEFIAMDAS
jgi:hypothetical protein